MVQDQKYVTLWESNSLTTVCQSCLLTIAPHEVPFRGSISRSFKEVSKFISLFLLTTVQSAEAVDICRFHLCRVVRPNPQRVSLYDFKQSDGEAPALELWAMPTAPLHVLDMTLSNLVARLQSWNFGQYKIPLHCLSKLELKYLLGLHLWVK